MLTPSRRAAAAALHAVFGEGRRVPEGWDGGLESQDASLARAILGLCLRRWGRLQAWFEGRLRDPQRGAPLGSRIAAAMGAAQLAWLPGVSAHAAVHEAVALAGDPHLGFSPHRGLVNAVLRAAAQDREALARRLEGFAWDQDLTPFARATLEAALAPRGQQASLRELWERLQTEPASSFVAVKEGVLPEGLELDPSCPGGLRWNPAVPFPRPWLASGAGMAQDRSSQALMAFAWDRHPARILDLCAAPGGKTTSLALRYPAARLTAVEQAPRRMARLRQNLSQRGVTAQVVQADAMAWLQASTETFDLILIDAPCSGSGTLRKHPELAWIGDIMDRSRLVETQQRLLDSAVVRLAPGGLLLYAVCSWFPEEGLGHRERCVARHSELAPARVWPRSLGLGEDPSSLFLPDPLGWDGEGFQAFAFCRKSGVVARLESP